MRLISALIVSFVLCAAGCATQPLLSGPWSTIVMAEAASFNPTTTTEFDCMPFPKDAANNFPYVVLNTYLAPSGAHQVFVISCSGDPQMTPGSLRGVPARKNLECLLGKRLEVGVINERWAKNPNLMISSQDLPVERMRPTRVWGHEAEATENELFNPITGFRPSPHLNYPVWTQVELPKELGADEMGRVRLYLRYERMTEINEMPPIAGQHLVLACR